MTREEMLNRPKGKKSIDLDGEQIATVRKLTGEEVEYIAKNYKDGKENQGYRYIVARCVVDDAGNRVFEDKDVDTLAKQENDWITAIAEGAMRFSGLLKDHPANT